MLRPLLLIFCLVLLLADVARLSAHDPLGYDGTVVKMDLKKDVLTIETLDNGQDTTVDITFNATTSVTKDGKPVQRSALKKGAHVLVDALGCIDDPQIDGVAVRILPPGSRTDTARSGMAMAPMSQLGTEIPKGDRIPTVALHADGLSAGGWSFSVTTTLVMTMAMSPYQQMRGHVHVYVDGKDGPMIAATQFTLPGLAPGRHTVRVVLAGTDHRTLLHGGVPIADSVEVVVPEAGR